MSDVGGEERGAAGVAPRWATWGADVLAVVFALALLGTHVAWIDEPWCNTHCGVNGGAYYGYGCRGFEAFGYLEARMQGMILFHPSGEGLARPYANHPATAYFILYPSYLLFGKDERSLRIPILLILLANLLITRFVFGRVAGRWVGAAATVGLASLPMFWHYGRMVDLPIFCLTFFVPVSVLWLRYRRLGTWGAWRTFALVAFAAALFDWYSYFLSVGILLDVVFSRGSVGERVRKLGLAAVPFAAAFTVVFSWLLWASGSLANLREHVLGLSLALKSRDAAASWGATVLENASYTTTLPFVVLVGVGLLAAVVRARQERVLRLGLMLVISGLMPMLAFRNHSADHEFWPMVSFTGLALLFGRGALALDEVARRVVPTGLVFLLLLGAVGAFGAMEGREFNRLRVGESDMRGFAAALNEDFGPKDLVFTPDQISPSRFDRNFVTLPGMRARVFLDAALERLEPYRDQFDSAYFLLNRTSPAEWQWITQFPALELTEATYADQAYFKWKLDYAKLWD